MLIFSTINTVHAGTCNFIRHIEKMYVVVLIGYFLDYSPLPHRFLRVATALHLIPRGQYHYQKIRAISLCFLRQLSQKVPRDVRASFYLIVGVD